MMLKEQRPAPKPKRTRLDLEREELELQEYNREVDKALKERSKRHRTDAIQTELRDWLNTFLYDDIVAEAQRAYGTEHTRNAYKTCWNKYEAFCAENGFPALPTLPEVAATYLIYAARENPKLNTQRIISSLAFYNAWANSHLDTSDHQIRGAVRWINRQQSVKESDEAEETRTINGQGRPN
jgi:hypothetical protein